MPIITFILNKTNVEDCVNSIESLKNQTVKTEIIVADLMGNYNNTDYPNKKYINMPEHDIKNDLLNLFHPSFQFFSFINSGDIYSNSKLEESLDVTNKYNPHIGAVYTDEFDINGDRPIYYESFNQKFNFKHYIFSINSLKDSVGFGPGNQFLENISKKLMIFHLPKILSRFK